MGRVRYCPYPDITEAGRLPAPVRPVVCVPDQAPSFGALLHTGQARIRCCATTRTMRGCAARTRDRLGADGGETTQRYPKWYAYHIPAPRRTGGSLGPESQRGPGDRQRRRRPLHDGYVSCGSRNQALPPTLPRQPSSCGLREPFLRIDGRVPRPFRGSGPISTRQKQCPTVPPPQGNRILFRHVLEQAVCGPPNLFARGPNAPKSVFSRYSDGFLPPGTTILLAGALSKLECDCPGHRPPSARG